MCSNIRLSKHKSVVKGHKAPFISLLGAIPREGTFGLNNGLLYNCRSERCSFKDATWLGKPFKRGLVEMVGFYEGGADFAHVDDRSMFAACLYNSQDEFIIITENSSGVVAKYHPRMPMLVDPEISSLQAWMLEGRIIHLKPQLIRRA